MVDVMPPSAKEQDIAAAHVLAPERGSIGAGGKEHRVPERDLSGLQQQHDAKHHDGLGENERKQRRPTRDEERQYPPSSRRR